MLNQHFHNTQGVRLHGSVVTLIVQWAWFIQICESMWKIPVNTCEICNRKWTFFIYTLKRIVDENGNATWKWQDANDHHFELSDCGGVKVG